jgi:histidinol dehydrogenase
LQNTRRFDGAKVDTIEVSKAEIDLAIGYVSKS